MAVEQKPTFCRICEPLCGMIATVEDGRLIALRPDKDHPLSSGFACQKGIAFTEVVNDPDRVTTPLRRTPTGFEPVTWDEAMTDIAARLSDDPARHGSGAVGWYYGQPRRIQLLTPVGAMIVHQGYRTPLPLLHRRPRRTPATGFVASQLLYGVAHVGADTRSASHRPARHDRRQSRCLARQFLDRAADQGPHARRRQARGTGRRRRSAQDRDRRAFEWMGIVPDTDAFFLLSLLHVMFAEASSTARVWLAGRRARLASARSRRCSHPESTAALTGIEPDDRAGPRARSARLSAPRSTAGWVRASGEYGTLTTYLIDAVNLVAGNLDVPGGSRVQHASACRASGG